MRQVHFFKGVKILRYVDSISDYVQFENVDHIITMIMHKTRDVNIADIIVGKCKKYRQKNKNRIITNYKNY